MKDLDKPRFLMQVIIKIGWKKNRGFEAVKSLYERHKARNPHHFLLERFFFKNILKCLEPN